MALAGTFFNASFYLAQNTDVAINWVGSAFDHYQQYGWMENRAPNSWFSAQDYRVANADLANMNALQLFEHYEKFGFMEGRAPSTAYANFDEQQYLDDYADLEPAGITIDTALNHYLVYGASEDRVARNDDGSVITGGELNTGTTFTLTTGADAPVGGAQNDTFIATETTLSSADVLDGGAGADVLRYASSGSSAVNEAGFESSLIETIKITTDATGGTTFDVTGVTGATAYENNNSSTDLMITNSANIASLTMSNVSDGNTTLDYTASAVSGSADTQWLFLNNVVDPSAPTVATSSVSIGNGGAGIETLNIHTTGAASNLTGITTGASTINITGNQNLTIANALVGATTINAGQTDNVFTGNLNVVANSAGTALDVAITGGSGMDTADFSAGFEAGDSFDGGDNTDTIGLTNAVATGTPGGSLSNVEILDIGNAAGTDAGTGTIDMDNFSGISKVIYDDGLTAGATTTVDDAVEGLAVEVDVTNAATANLTVDLKTDGTADTLSLYFDEVDAGDQIGTVTVDDAETLNINVDDDTTGGTGTFVLNNLDLDAAGTASALTTLNISGDADFTIAAFDNGATPTVATIDASNLTGALGVNGGIGTFQGPALVATGATITFGSGGTDWTMGAASGSETGGDTFTLGAGADILRYTAVNQSTGLTSDTIMNFTQGSDILNLNHVGGTNAGVISSSGFLGNAANTTAAETALAAGGLVEAVFVQDEGVLVVDANNDGNIGAGDLRLVMDGITSMTAADLGFTTGVTFTANQAGFNTATAANSTENNAVGNEDDTINATVTQINNAATTVDGLLGTDTLNITGTGVANLTTGTFAGNTETIILGTGVTGLTAAPADIAGVTTLTGSATTQTLSINASDDLTGITIRNIETLDDGGTNAAITFTMDADNFTNITALTLNGGVADTLALADGTYNFTSIALTFGTAGSILDLNTNGNGAKTVTADAADLANIATITGETTAVTTTLNLNDTDDLSGVAITNVDVLTIGGTTQSLTVDDQDFTATNFTTVTGSGTSTLVIQDEAGGDNAVSLVNTTISGFTGITTDHGNSILTLDAASISGTVTLTGDATSDITISQTGDFTNITITGGDYDDLVINDGVTATFDEGFFAGNINALDGAGGGNAVVNINMGTTGTLDLSSITEGGAQAIATVAVTGTTGADTITGLDITSSGITHTIDGGAGDDILIITDDVGAALTTGTVSLTGGAGSDQFRLSDSTAAAAGGVFDLDKAVVITDFDANSVDSLQFAAALANDNSVSAIATGAAMDLENEGIILITGASVADFTSEAQAITAIGNAVTADGDGSDDVVFVIQNAAGTQAGLYLFDDAAGALAGANVNAGDLQLIGLATISNGTLDTTDLQIF